MTKVTDRARDGKVRDERVAVQLSTPQDAKGTRLAIALPKDAPPSNYIPMEPHVSDAASFGM